MVKSRPDQPDPNAQKAAASVRTRGRSRAGPGQTPSNGPARVAAGKPAGLPAQQEVERVEGLHGNPAEVLAANGRNRV